MEPVFHVAVLVFPFSSHPNALLQLVKLLSEAAPNVTFSFLSTATSNAALFKRSSCSSSQLVHNNIKPFNVFDGIPKGHVFSCRDQNEEVMQLFFAATPGNFSEAIRVAEAETGRRVTCLITDTFLWFGSDLALEIGVPWISYFISGACPLLTIFRMDHIRELISTNGKKEEPLQVIPEVTKVEIDDLPPEFLESENTPFTEILRKTGLKLPNTAAVVVNSFEELEPVVTLDLKSNLKKFLCIGPTANLISPPRDSLSDEGESCLRWLDNWGPTSVVYVAFGTLVLLPPEEIFALGEALEELQLPFLWSMKDDFMRFLPDGFLERTKGTGKFVSWAPQVQVLKHGSVGAFVSHGGWNSITEGIVGMVPMICRPFFADNTLNTRMVESVWEIGLKIPNGKFTKTGAIATLTRLLSLKDSHQMRTNIRHLRDLATKALEPHGSSSANFKTLLEIITN